MSLHRIKRICCIIAAAVILVSCTSVGGTLLDYQTAVSGATVRWEYDGCKYEAELIFEGDIPEEQAKYRRAAVKLTSPEEIAGLTVRYYDDGGAVSVGTVSFDLPKNTGNEVYRIVRSLSLYPDEMNYREDLQNVRFATLEGESTVYYDMTYGDDGCPKTAVISWGDGKTVTVEYVELRMAQMWSTTETT